MLLLLLLLFDESIEQSLLSMISISLEACFFFFCPYDQCVCVCVLI